MTAIPTIPIDPGVTGWNAVLPERTVNPSLSDQQVADYLIIGAGFAGLSAARRLQQCEPDARIVILEGKQVAQGPAGRNSGFMIDLPHDLSSDDYAGSSSDYDKQQTALNRAAIRFAQQAAEAYAMPAEALVESGKINAAATQQGMAHNQEYMRHLDALGEHYKALDASAMQALTGIEYYQQGVWTPGTVMLQPALYIRGLAEGVTQSNHVLLYEQSPVIELTQQNNQPNQSNKTWLAKTPHGSVKAQKVILAVNGLVQHFGFYSRQLMHVFTYASMTRALTSAECKALGGENHWAFTPADPLGTTVRRISGLGGDRIIIRNRATYDPNMQVSDKRMQSVARTHQRGFKVRFPMLDKVTMEYCWGGRLCLSRNGVFALGEVEEGLFSACCQNGLGTAKGTLAGIIAAEQACGSSETLVPDYKAEAAPQTLLLPEPVMSLVANSYLRYKEFRAGREF